ncbi:PREDICTED: translation initiation factor IF-2-like, partial [Chinchilla lanigera]|uniref:translation initiation factor IF-2-like n=1 Tax=Chinchilla lanigera TaxID=34839 RepID=UPI000696235A
MPAPEPAPQQSFPLSPPFTYSTHTNTHAAQPAGAGRGGPLRKAQGEPQAGQVFSPTPSRFGTRASLRLPVVVRPKGARGPGVCISSASEPQASGGCSPTPGSGSRWSRPSASGRRAGAARERRSDGGGGGGARVLSGWGPLRQRVAQVAAWTRAEAAGPHRTPAPAARQVSGGAVAPPPPRA